MLSENKEYQDLAGANLCQAISSPDMVIYSEAPTEMEARSEADLEADLELDLDMDLVPVQLNDQDA